MFFLIFVLLYPSSFPHVLVFVSICNSSPLQCAFVFISITFNLCLGVHLHLHRAQVKILWFVFGLCYLCLIIYVLLFVFSGLHLLFCSCFVGCFAFCYFAFFLCFAKTLCWNVLFFAIYFSHFVLCWNTSCSIEVLLTLVFSLCWSTYCSIEALCTLVFLLPVLRSVLLQYFSLWCSCFTLCYLCSIALCFVVHLHLQMPYYIQVCFLAFVCFLFSFACLYLFIFFMVFIFLLCK